MALSTDSLSSSKLCDSLAKYHWFSIFVFIVGGILIVASIVLYLRTQDESISDAEQKKRMHTFKMTLGISLIVITVLVVVRCCMMQFTWKSQCRNIQSFLLKSLSSDNISNVLSQSVGQITDKYLRPLKETLDAVNQAAKTIQNVQ